MTISPVSVSHASSSKPPLEAQRKPQELADAARQFEALLIGQLLKAACSPAMLTGGEPEAAECTAIEMAQEHLATTLAQQGGFGLARMIAKTARTEPSVAAPETKPEAVR